MSSSLVTRADDNYNITSTIIAVVMGYDGLENCRGDVPNELNMSRGFNVRITTDEEEWVIIICSTLQYIQQLLSYER